MSVYLDDIKDLQIYRNKFYLPIDKKDRRCGSAIFLLTKSMDDSLALMQNPMFVNIRSFISYYIERDVMFYLQESGLVPNDSTSILESLTKKERDSIPEKQFGLPEERKFPLDTEEHVKSAIHLFGKCEEDKKHELAKRIMDAASKFGIEVDKSTEVYKYANQQAVKEEQEFLEYVSAKDKATLKDSDYGIPEDKKFPLNTEQRVKSAIRLFGHAEESKKVALAKRIIKKAKEYGIEVKDTTEVYKYANGIVKEEVINESLSLTFYHGSDKKVEYLNPDSLMMGNKVEGFKWAVYMWRIKENALYFAAQKAVRDNLKKVDTAKKYDKPVYDALTYRSFLVNTQYDDIKKLSRGLKFYRYTVKAPISSVGIGHSSAIPEYTSTARLKVIKTEEFTMDDALFDRCFESASKKTIEDTVSKMVKGEINRGILAKLMYPHEKVYEKMVELRTKMKSGDIKPGDTVNIVMDSFTDSDTDRESLSEEQIQMLKEEVTYEVVREYKRLANNTSSINEDFMECNVDGKEFRLVFGEAIDSILDETTMSSQQYTNKFRRLLYQDRMRTQKEQMLVYDYIKDHFVMIQYAYIRLSLYKKRNLFVDLSYYVNAFFKNNMYRLDTGIDLFMELVSRSIKDKRLDSEGYNKKTVFIPLDKWVTKDELAWDYSKSINPVSIIYRLIYRKDLTLLKDKWGGVVFVFMTDSAYFKFSLDDFDKNSLPKFKNAVSKLQRNDIADAENITTDSPDVLVTKFADRLGDAGIEIRNLIGSESKDKNSEEKFITSKNILNSTNDEAKKAALISKVKDIASKSTSEEDVINSIDNNKEDKEWLTKLIVDLQSDEGININKARISRMNTLNSEFLNKEIDGKSISTYLKNAVSKDIETDTIPIDSMNEEWKNVKFSNFSREYDLDADVVSIFASMIDKSEPLSIISCDKEDTSTSEDYIETWTVKFEDYNGKRFQVKLDVPKFIDGRFMRLRGNIKTLQGQLLLLPIIKTDEDTAQIVSNYNKIFIKRFNPSNGSKTTAAVSRLTKILNKYKGDTIKVVEGDNSFVCAKYELPVEYRDLAGLYSKIIAKDGSYVSFNMDDMKELHDKLSPKDKDLEGIYLIYDKKENKVISSSFDHVADDIMTFIFNAAEKNKDEELMNIINSSKPSDKLSYSSASILNTDIPVIVVMAYSEGLQVAMKKANIDFSFYEKKPTKLEDVANKAFIKFSDGYIAYYNTVAASLLMNGLSKCDTEFYSIKDINKKEMWIDFLENFGGRIKADGLDNFYDLMIDPITKEVCEIYHLPTDYVSILAYASSLLTDTKYNKHVDITGNRIRTNEVVAGYVYKAIAGAYGDYKSMLKRNKSNATLSVKQSAVLDGILTDPTSSDLSVLSPLLEAEASSALSFKGLSGMNSDRSYSLDKRIYDESMFGVLASSTGFAGNVGITRQASINAGVKGTRGVIAPSKEKNTLNVLSITEALTPLSTTHDDPIRVAMNYIQSSKHQMRVKRSCPNLITTGMDEALPYMTSNIFSYKFKGHKGKVLEVTDDYIIYEDSDTKERGFVDIRDNVMKNSDGGFFVTVKLDPCVRKGQVLKYNTILAYDKTSYSKAVGSDMTSNNNLSYNVGTLAKIAIMPSDFAYEDSSIITDSLSDSLSTEYCVKKDRVLSKDSNVYNLVAPGTPIEEGDPLMIFQNAFDEKDANMLLKTITDDEIEAVNDLGRIHLRSKLTGVVQDVKIYRTCDINELSPTLKKIVTDYEKKIKKDKKMLNSYGISDTTTLEPDYKLEPTGKLKAAADGVLIEIYLKATDKMGIGDKLVYGTALKGVLMDVIEKGQEPYTDFRPNENVEAILTTSGVLARMVSSIILYGSINKAMLELDRACKELLGIKWKNLYDMDFTE